MADAPIFNDGTEPAPAVGNLPDVLAPEPDSGLPADASQLDRIEAKLDNLIDGVNSIGEIIDGVGQGVGQLIEKVQREGIGALLAGAMGAMKGPQNG